MSAPLKVPRAAVQVSLQLEHGDPVQATLFVPPSLGERPGQAVHALLEQDNIFVPARMEQGPTLHNKTRLRWISVPRDQDAQGLDELYDVYQTVELLTAGGRQITGDLLFSAPQERRRVGDYLNRPEQFLCLYQEHQILLLNKRYLVSVMEAPCPR